MRSRSRQECDYKDFFLVTEEDAINAVKRARKFLAGIKGLLAGNDET